MATFETQEFKFPHESEDKGKPAEEEIEIEIEGENTPVKIEIRDDTPEEDRGRKPMTEPPEEVTEEELSKYKDGRLRDRLAHLNKGYHDERRAKEKAEREREEALSIAQRILQENEQLKGDVDSNHKMLIDQAKSVASKELDEAKRKYKVAHESGDSDALLAAQEALTDVRLKIERINNFRPKPLQVPRNTVQTQQAPQNPASEVRRDDKAEDWVSKNNWFNRDREMTGFALAVHERLVEDEGINPRSNTYYERVDARMREKFPEKFGDGSGGNEKPRRSNTVVAPATRSTAPRKIVLTPSAVSIAKRLGIPLDVYAKQVAKEMRDQNG